MKLLLILLTISLSNVIFAGATLTVYLEENQITEKVVFQCEDLNECAERVQARMESENGCDPRVKKVVIETVHIPGLDDA
ncbi:hypothetical protein SPONN_1627 [uncultured Candidatus Thioglobus sp.]|nr:hypothetical protein SPONN_1627 [uncultured Candidatus Thioglobus sp.]